MSFPCCCCVLLLLALCVGIAVLLCTGANIGQSVSEWNFLAPATEWYLFEPLQQTASLLRQKFGSRSNVHIKQMAVSNFLFQLGWSKSNQLGHLVMPRGGEEDEYRAGVPLGYRRVDIPVDSLDHLLQHEMAEFPSLVLLKTDT